MRVCVVCAALPPFYAGAEQRAFQHVQRLNRRAEIEMLLVGLHRFRKGQIPGPELPNNVHGVWLHFFDEGSTRNPRLMVNLTLHISEVSLRLGSLFFQLRQQYDLVHVFNPALWFNLLSIPIARVLKKSVIAEMTLLGMDDPLKLSRQESYARGQRPPRRPLKYRLFLGADAYISKSFGLSHAYHQAGLPKDKLFQIPSGVDVERFRPPQGGEKQSLRRQLDLPEGGYIILFVGGIEERKGPDRLLNSFRPLASQYPQAHLALVGPSERFDPGYVQQLRQNIIAWGLSERVSLREGVAPNVDEYMRAADIFALPSRREGLSLVILEAMAIGLAVVASDIPEVTYSQIQPGAEGLLVPVDDTQQLSAALAGLIADPGQCAVLGQGARERVLREFTHKVVDEQYIHMYRQVYENHLKRSC